MEKNFKVGRQTTTIPEHLSAVSDKVVIPNNLPQSKDWEAH